MYSNALQIHIVALQFSWKKLIAPSPLLVNSLYPRLNLICAPTPSLFPEEWPIPNSKKMIRTSQK
jgi:hypothetical protein